MKLSIITICYNSEKTIKSTLDSVASQTYKIIEHIVVDGSSTDSTMCIIKKYPHIKKIISEPDKGIYDALNKGIKISSGDIIGILHADDIFYDNQILEDVIQLFKKYPNKYLLSGNVVFFDDVLNNTDNRIIRSGMFRPWMLRFGFMPAHTATFFRSSIFKKFGLYDPSFKSAGDFEFFLRLILVNKVKLFFLNKILVRMKTKGKSTSGIISYIRTSNEILNAFKKNALYSNYLFILLRLPLKQINKWIFQLMNKK